MTLQSGTTWTATLPAFQCGDDPRFYVRVTGSGGSVQALPTTAPATPYSLRVGTFSSQPLFDVAFDGGLPAGWTATGLWHVSTGCPPPGACGSGGARAYFGQDSTCNFSTGARVAGILRSPNVTLPTLQSGQSITLSFCSALDNECPNKALGDVDQAILWWVRSNGQANPVNWFVDHSIATQQAFSLNQHAGTTGRLEWRFEAR